MNYEIIAVALPLIAFGFFFLAVKLSKEHGAIQFFFLILGMLVITPTMWILQKIAENNAQTEIANTISYLFSGMVIATILLMFYFIIVVIKNTLIQSAEMAEKGV